MSETSGEKTEQPTPKKERDARKEGQVARSQEVATTISLFAVLAYLYVFWDYNFQQLTALMDAMASMALRSFEESAFGAISLLFDASVRMLMPILAITIATAIIGNVGQFGFLVAGKNLVPKLHNVSFAKGFKQIFSMKSLVEVLKAIVKIVFMTVLLLLVLRSAVGAYLSSVKCGMPCLLPVTKTVMVQTLLYSAFAFVVVAVADYWFQKRTHIKSLMMSKDEVKREHKESEGDPFIKGKRKQLAQELAMSNDIGRTQKATAMVVNPTHLAIAIDYTPGETALPVVVAKGRNLYAHKLRENAEAAGVPIFRNVPLARSLFAETEVDDYVPDELFDAIAEILAWVNRNKDLLYQGRLEHGDIDMAAGDHFIPTKKNTENSPLKKTLGS